MDDKELLECAEAYAEGLFQDVILEVNGKEYSVHKLILCSNSSVFEVMFANSEWSESQSHKMVITETPECAAVFEELLGYFYTSRISIELDSVLPYLILADKYYIDDLLGKCVKYMREHITNACETGIIVSWFDFLLSTNHHQMKPVCDCQKVDKDDSGEYSDDESLCSYDCCLDKSTENLCSDTKKTYSRMAVWEDDVAESCQCGKFSDWEQLRRACRNMIKWNFEMIANTPNFGNLDCKLFSSLLLQNDLLVESEIKLFDYVVNWINLQEARLKSSGLSERAVAKNVSSIIRATLTNIRYALMTPMDLAMRVYSNARVQNQIDCIAGYLRNANLYQTRDFRQPDACNHMTPLLAIDGVLRYTPRLYTSSKWSTIVSVDYVNFPQYSRVEAELVTSSSITENSARTLKWQIDIYPKGVEFGAIYAIDSGTNFIEIPSVRYDTTRAKITLRNREVASDRKIRVKIGFLLYGMVNGIDAIVEVIQSTRTFTEDENAVNFDELWPNEFFENAYAVKYNELVRMLMSNEGVSLPFPLLGGVHYLIGDMLSMLRIKVIMMPLCAGCAQVDKSSNSSKRTAHIWDFDSFNCVPSHRRENSTSDAEV